MKCKEQVWRPGAWRPSPCSRNAVGETGYCKQHNPETVAAKRKERDAKYVAKFAKEMRIIHLHAAAPDMLEALELAVAIGMVPVTSASEGGAAKFSEQVRVADMIRAAIKKARGEK